MMIHSDWHIHSEHSYDASNSLEAILEGAKARGLRRVGITDHANFNDEKFMGDLRNSAAAVKTAQKDHPFLVLGVEQATETFRHQYAEFLRELFEMGIPITYGSDSHHNNYEDLCPPMEAYLTAAGFKDGDFAELTEADMW